MNLLNKKNKAIIKFNNGNGAVLCSKCSIIIREGSTMTEDDWRHVKHEIVLPAQYCEKCNLT